MYQTNSVYNQHFFRNPPASRAACLTCFSSRTFHYCAPLHLPFAQTLHSNSHMFFLTLSSLAFLLVMSHQLAIQMFHVPNLIHIHEYWTLFIIRKFRFNSMIFLIWIDFNFLKIWIQIWKVLLNLLWSTLNPDESGQGWKWKKVGWQRSLNI